MSDRETMTERADTEIPREALPVVPTQDGDAVVCTNCGETIERGNVLKATTHVVVCRTEVL